MLVNIILLIGNSIFFFPLVKKRMDIYSEFLALLDRAIEKCGNAKKLADVLEVHPNLITRWKRGERVPTITSIQPLLDFLGVGFSAPSVEQSKDVCFVDARAVPAGEHLPSPPDEDYLAVPLVDEVGAGPGIIPQNQLISWFLVWRHQRAIQHKRDLIAVMIGKNSTSMLPTLKPQDIVLVDRQDKDVMNFTGRIMLVLDPVDGSGKIKRVAAENQPRKRDCRITYYSDNAAENPPEVYSLIEDFEGDWNRAIVGRVVWAWSDVSNK